MDPLTLALIAGGSAIVSGGANVLATNNANAANRELWREQVEYNTPENQMLRMKNAEKVGLNPALIYGHGSVTNIAGSPPRMDAPHVPSPMSDVAATQQVMNQDLTRQTMEANLTAARANARNATATAASTEADNAYKDAVQNFTAVRPGVLGGSMLDQTAGTAASAYYTANKQPDRPASYYKAQQVEEAVRRTQLNDEINRANNVYHAPGAGGSDYGN